MKRKLIAVAVSSVLAAPAAALADVTVGGQVNASYGSHDTETFTTFGSSAVDSDQFELNNQASRLTVKGSEDLGGDLKANFFLEWGIDIDGSSDGQNPGSSDYISRRNQWVGLSGSSWGETRFGRHDTPLKFAQGKYDVFNDQQGDFGSIVLGEVRADNVLAYISPNFNGFGVAIAGIPGEGAEADGSSNSEKDGFADFYSANATYSNGPFFVSAAYDYFDGDASAAGTTSLLDDRIRVIGTYNTGAFMVGAMYETNDFDNTGVAGAAEEYDVWGVSGKYSFGNNAVKAMYHAGSLEQDTFSDEDSTKWSVGFDHSFSKRTRVYAEYTYQEDENEGPVGGVDDDERTFWGVGVFHKF